VEGDGPDFQPGRRGGRHGEEANQGESKKAEAQQPVHVDVPLAGLGFVAAPKPTTLITASLQLGAAAPDAAALAAGVGPAGVEGEREGA
jgi:hypothetical protein